MNISNRVFFAATCSDSELAARMPATVEGMRDALISRGIISSFRKNVDGSTGYSDSEVAKLRCAIRFEYADDMISTP